MNRSEPYGFPQVEEQKVTKGVLGALDPHALPPFRLHLGRGGHLEESRNAIEVAEGKKT